MRRWTEGFEEMNEKQKMYIIDKVLSLATKNSVTKDDLLVLMEYLANKTKKETTEWIDPKEKLPEPFVSVLVCMPGEEPFPTVHEGFVSSWGWYSQHADRNPEEIAYWRPMPAAPLKEEKT